MRALVDHGTRRVARVTRSQLSIGVRWRLLVHAAIVSAIAARDLSHRPRHDLLEGAISSGALGRLTTQRYRLAGRNPDA
jgi:hypothetical protein